MLSDTTSPTPQTTHEELQDIQESNVLRSLQSWRLCVRYLTDRLWRGKVPPQIVTVIRFAVFVKLPKSRRQGPKLTLICAQGLVKHCPEFVTIIVDSAIPLRHTDRASGAEQVLSIACVVTLRLSSRVSVE